MQPVAAATDAHLLGNGRQRLVHIPLCAAAVCPVRVGSLGRPLPHRYAADTDGMTGTSHVDICE